MQRLQLAQVTQAACIVSRLYRTPAAYLTLCTVHSACLQAEVVVKRGEPELQWRFCFQCGKLELLDRFEGKQRCEARKREARKLSSWLLIKSTACVYTVC